MNQPSNSHLSQEALDDVLIGVGSTGAQAHLAECAHCRARLTALSGIVSQLDASSLAWSRVRAAGLPEPRAGSGSHHWRFATMVATLGALLLTLLAVPVWHHQQMRAADADNAGRAASIQHPLPPVEISAAEIAADNQLLHDVDSAVNTNEALPFVDPIRTGRPRHTHRARPE